LYGVFNVAGATDVMPTPLPDGEYADVLSDALLQARDGAMAVPESAVIVRYEGVVDPRPYLQRPIMR
jgi:hypothetical protein